MQINLFENFDLDLKACITWKNGVLIGYRTSGSCYMSLYRLNNFYVEIQYSTCRDGVNCIRTFVCEDELHAYLEQVDISQLLD